MGQNGVSLKIKLFFYFSVAFFIVAALVFYAYRVRVPAAGPSPAASDEHGVLDMLANDADELTEDEKTKTLDELEEGGTFIDPEGASGSKNVPAPSKTELSEEEKIRTLEALQGGSAPAP